MQGFDRPRYSFVLFYYPNHIVLSYYCHWLIIMYFFFVCVCVCVCVFCGFICVRVKGAVWKTFCNMADFYTDIIFTMVLIVRTHWLAWYCALFTFVPHIIGNVICLVKMQMWREKDKYISKYIDRYDWFLIVISVFAGFYSAVEMARSRIGYLSLFGLQISRLEYQKQKTFRFLNTVVLEFSFNLPKMYTGTSQV